MKKYIAFLFVTVCCYTAVKTQTPFDSSYLNATALYNQTINLNKHLYTGKEYNDYNHQIKGNPFFQSTYFEKGSVTYNGIVYTDVQLFYDVLHDDVVIKNYNDTPLILIKEKISEFDYNAHHFINTAAADNAIKLLPAGFYDVLFNGNVKLFAKRTKEVIEKITTQYSDSYFQEKDKYYILKDGNLNLVSNKNDVLASLKDRKKDLLKYIRQNEIKFRKNPEEAMIKLVACYDALKQN